MRTRLTLAALGLSLAVGACDRDTPTSPAAPGSEIQAPTAPQQQQALIFEGGQTFNGVAYTNTVQVTKFNYNAGQLTIDGRITWKDATGAVVNVQDFTGWPADLTRGTGAPTSPVCEILVLDIGAIHLDLLGLVVDLAPVHLDITAESGPGNLLGNLLCAVAGLLDPQPPAGSALGTAITNLLNTINQLLQGLL